MRKLVLFLLMLLPCSLFANTVGLAWDRSPVVVDGYNVYRSVTSGTGYAKVNVGLVMCFQPICPYTDVTPTNSTFYYVVTAVIQNVESGYSNEVVANVIGPPAPTNLRVTSVTATLNLFVDKVQVASGSSPLNYILPRVTPPRERLITVTLQSFQ